MPGPPPPPPAAPPPPLFTAPKGGGGGGGPNDRSALLKSIQQGAKLKKTVTVDKSAPMIPGKVAQPTTPANNGTIGRAAGANVTTSAPMTNGLGLGGLFAGGMPKLRATGIQLDGAASNTTPTEHTQPNRSNNKQRSPDIPSSTIKPKTPETPTPTSNTNFSNIQNQLKKQLALDSRSRGPPPPAPVRTPSDDTQVSKQTFTMRNGSSSSNSSSSTTISSSITVQQQSSSTLNLSTLQANVSTLHRKANSNVNISTLDSSLNNNLPVKPVISHGKPNLAPKPPLNGKPATPPKKLMINGKPVGRAQSMKTPRSPTPQSPDNNNSAAAKFGTVRNMTSVLNSSLTASTGNLTTQQRPRPALNVRPSAPPPSIPSSQPPPPPPSKTNVVKPPNHAPPPPPNVPLPQPPNHAPPPPPPQRTQAPQVPSRAPPAIPQHNTVNNNNNNNCAPPPPPRHSSIRGDSNNSTLKRASLDLDAKFADRFHPVSHFPKPPPFRRVFKSYSSKQVGSKQPAPQPPIVHQHHHHHQSRSWDASAC